MRKDYGWVRINIYTNGTNGLYLYVVIMMDVSDTFEHISRSLDTVK